MGDPESDEIQIIEDPNPLVSMTSGRECPICLESFTKVGQHRVVVTKCGHTFGKNCVFRCLEIKNECPTCRKKVRKRDLIDLYDCEVVAVDNSKIEKIRVELQEARSHREQVGLSSVLFSFF